MCKLSDCNRASAIQRFLPNGQQTANHYRSIENQNQYQKKKNKKNRSTCFVYLCPSISSALLRRIRICCGPRVCIHFQGVLYLSCDCANLTSHQTNNNNALSIALALVVVVEQIFDYFTIINWKDHFVIVFCVLKIIELWLLFWYELWWWNVFSFIFGHFS